MNAADETPGKMMLLKDADWLDSYGRDLVEEGDADLEQTGLHLERIAERIRSVIAALHPTQQPPHAGE